MKLLALPLIVAFTLVSSFSYAQVATEGVQSFGQAEGAWRRTEEEKIEPLERFVDDAGKFAINNIVNAEQVFCYEVFPINENYESYTLNGFPIRGFCGILGDQVKQVFVQYFLSESTSVDFQNTETCVIQPKIMMRFVRGVDYTDVLLSSPCHSFAIFYGGGVSVYNFRPGAEIIDALVDAVKDQHTEFVSPALLGQLLPIGVVQNEQQRKTVNQKNEPIREWEKRTQEEAEKKAEEDKKNSSGWNKLKTRLQ